jgi:hypothetical protein
VKADAESSEDSNSMSSDDTDFNPDELEAKSAKEEYDSDPSDTGTGSVGLRSSVSDLDPHSMGRLDPDIQIANADPDTENVERAEIKNKKTQPKYR